MSDSLASQSDAELLKRFSKTRCERVFEELVSRYGRLVMAISLRTLRNQHDAEDVFQATFLVLAEKSGSIRKRNSLSSWLTGTAHRLSIKLAQKRHRKDLALVAEPVAARDQFSNLEQRFDEQAMDEELQSLPSKYRDVLLRFYFLGQTSRQIAESLGISQGVADGRIKRGRQELRVRLAKRGVALGAFTVMALSAQTASAAVAPTLVQSTVAAAAAKGSAGLASFSVLKLVGPELMRTSSMISSVAAASAVLVFLALGTFGLNAAFARSMAGQSLVDAQIPIAENSLASVLAETEAIVQFDSGQALKTDGPQEKEKPASETSQAPAAPVQPERLLEEYQLRTKKYAKVVGEVLSERIQNLVMEVNGTKVRIYGPRDKMLAIRALVADTQVNLERDEVRDLKLAKAVRDRGGRIYQFEKIKAQEAFDAVTKARLGLRLQMLPGDKLVIDGEPDAMQKVQQLLEKLEPGAGERKQSRPQPASGSNSDFQPTLVTARISQDARTVALTLVGDANSTISRKYSVLVPADESEKGRAIAGISDGKMMVRKQRNLVLARGKSLRPALHQVYNLRFTLVSGKQVPAGKLMGLLKDETPAVLLLSGQSLSELHKRMLKESTLVIQIPTANK